MNFWNIKKIKDDLSNQKVNQRDLFAYCFLYGLIAAILIFPVDYDLFFYYQEESSKWVEWGSTNLIYLITIFLCFKANKGSWGNNFIE